MITSLPSAPVPATASPPPPAPLAFAVDDDPKMLTLIGAAVRAAGYCVRAFTSGVEAVAEAEKVMPDLLLVDLNMPNLSGVEIIDRLRERQPALPVIVISGVPLQEARAAAPAADAHVEKPFKITGLVQTVASLRAR